MVANLEASDISTDFRDVSKLTVAALLINAKSVETFVPLRHVCNAKQTFELQITL